MVAHFRPVIALLLGVGFLLTGHGLIQVVVPLRAAAEGFTAIQIGLLGSSYFVGFIAGCLAAPFVILRSGHIRAFAAMVALATATALFLPMAVGFAPWLACRALTGICLAGLYLVIESWLNDRATNETRGLVFSSYIVVNFLAIAGGQLLTTTGDIGSFQLFALGGLAIVLATIPVVLTRSAQPAPITLVRFRPRELYRRTPVGVVGVTLIGLATGSFWTLGTIYARGQGLSVNDAAVFMTIAVLGGALVQWPLGRASDHIDRRRILLVLLLVAAGVGLLAALLPFGQTALLLSAALIGATVLPGYSIVVAHAFDHADRQAYVETSAGLLLANGAGSAIGPAVASSFMEAVGPGGLFVFTAATQAALAVFIVWRLRQRPAPAPETKVDFQLGSTAQLGAVLTPEPLDPDDPNVAVPSQTVAANEPAIAADEAVATAGTAAPPVAEPEPAAAVLPDAAEGEDGEIGGDARARPRPQS